MESLVHYSNPAHAISLLGVLNEQRLKGQLCDIVLVVGDQRYQAHRSVLAASSEYFQSLFARRDSEHRTAVQLDFCEPEAFEIVLNYIYSSSLFVDKCSLAAIQELGYSLGIPFLTNIMYTRPQVSYCVSRKRMSFSEEDDSTYQKRSVIVRQGHGDQPDVGISHRRALHQHGKALKQSTPMSTEETPPTHPFKERGNFSGHAKSNATERSAPIISRTSEKLSKESDSKPISSTPASILKGQATTTPSVRPQLTSSVSFSESQIHYARLPPDPACDAAEDQLEPLYSAKPAFSSHQGENKQTVDRSGPLIKSLLRRSLSMDSPVPVFSPALELKDSQSREQSVVKLVSKRTESPPSESKHQATKGVPPLILRSTESDTCKKEDAQGAEVHVKTEPSSPLADPSDIIRITVGDNLPVNLRDFQMNFDESSRGYINHSAKRKVKMDSNSSPYKRSRGKNEAHLAQDDGTLADASFHSKVDNGNEEPGELRPNKMFKCWNCLKVFRSNAGLYRHVNMYHNPEKPYACDICHKRFHTNFKVWTHCQTQHGVVQNPAPSSSAYSVLDEKFQRKLIDIVREREIKKALILKLRRNKQVLQSQPFGKKSRRSRSTYGCPYCGKIFWFQSQFKQHLKMHSPEKSNQDGEGESDVHEKRDQVDPLKVNQGNDVYSCRLCSEKLSSPTEQGEHERGCRYATVCPYCGLRFSSTLVKKDHEAHCKYKKLTCLECMRTFKSSFSIWRHQVEVHNHNMMTVREQLTLSHQENSGEAKDPIAPTPSEEHTGAGNSREDTAVYSDSSAPPMFDSEDSSSYVPEDLSTGHHQGELQVKEEPQEEAVSDRETAAAVPVESEERDVWPCEKCGKLFRTHKDLERHQELLCHIKPFICHICHKAFRTNFRLWSHYQSHMSTPDELGTRGFDRRPSSPSPSPPLSTPTTAGPPAQPASPPKVPQPRDLKVTPTEEEPSGSSSITKHQRPEQDKLEDNDASLAKVDTTDKPLAPQESDTLFYHAPTLSALTFKRQYMCKLCHRTFKTAFSLWSHEQSHL
ncbi:zinc finger and BTB domain-containing protein 21 [Chanos chanos]|uniref:Zinc finger and BTB domain-containing protein 21 n=1 Tax=Chanos chanos TaxID=29144 RepID=A0A6J2WWE0_CHACN|nr:zinc finger and BTB domain-containing protein 21 [Chanos chanos]